MAPPHVNQAANSASSPIYKILYIVEIMENVLKYVPERDLIANATRTCKIFHEIISTSPTIQKLWWTTPEGTIWVWSNDGYGGIHPPGTPAEAMHANGRIRRATFRMSCTLHVFNPLLLEPHIWPENSLGPSKLPTTVAGWVTRYFNRFSADRRFSLTNNLNRRLETASRATASCRNMQLCRPPVKRLTMFVSELKDPKKSYPFGFRSNRQASHLENQDGITFGELIDAIAYNTSEDTIFDYLTIGDGIPFSAEEKAVFDWEEAQSSSVST